MDVPTVTLPSQSNDDDSSGEGSTDDNDESGDKEQGTSSRDNGESANEDELADFFDAANGEGDYAVKEFSCSAESNAFPLRTNRQL
jgi:hypothetical protein